MARRGMAKRQEYPLDNDGIFGERLRVFREQTMPVIEQYEREGLLVRVDGTGSANDVHARFKAAVASVRRRAFVS